MSENNTSTIHNIRQIYQMGRRILQSEGPKTPQGQQALVNVVMILISARRYAEAASFMEQANQKLSAEPFWQALQGDVLLGLRRLSEAEVLFRELHEREATNDLITVKLADVLRLHGKEQEAFELCADILRRDPLYHPALRGYAEEMVRLGHKEEALNVILRLLSHYGSVHDQSSEESKHCGLIFAKLLRDLDNIKYIVSLLQNTEGAPQALGFLAQVGITFGAVRGGVELLRFVLKWNPDSVQHLLQLVDALELLNLSEAALTLIKQYLTTHQEAVVQTLTAAMMLTVWEEKKSIPVLCAERESVTYAPEELGLLQLFYRLIRILFIQQHWDVVQALVETLEPVQAAGKDLHLTLIRNDNAYYLYIRSLIQVPLYCEAVFREAHKPEDVVYVIGDDQCLSLAGRTIHIQDQRRYCKPLLVSGAKLWHLRDESFSSAKVNFFQHIRQLPKKASVIFVFGELDCREGVLLAVERFRHDTVEAAINAVVDIYITILQKIVKQRPLSNVYVHPVPPVLNETRTIVQKFNRVLGMRLAHLKKTDPNTVIRWLDVESELLSDTQNTLKAEYMLDGAHLNPSYIALLEKALIS